MRKTNTDQPGHPGDARVQGMISGSKCVQVKGFMLLSQPKPGKHRPAKPCGRTKVHTFSGGGQRFLIPDSGKRKAIQGIFTERK